MKALVLSGGSGTRLRPLTYEMPKQLVPIGNKPVLEQVLENVRDLGVTEVGVVVGDWAARIAAAIGDGSRFGVRITYLHQDRPLGLAHCVGLARPFLGDDDFVLYLGDTMLPGGLVDVAAEFRATRPAARIVLARVPDPRGFGVAELGPDGRVRRLVEKPPRPRSDLAVIGVYFFTAAVHEAVRGIAPSPRGELEITDAIQWLIEHGAEVRAAEYAGYWRDTGTAEDILACNRWELATLDPALDGYVDAASRLSGPVRIEAGARVLRSRLRGPVVVAAGSTVADCELGPDVAVGRDCALAGARLADCIVLDGTAASGPRPVRGALIGPTTSVSVAGPEAEQAA